MLVQRIHLLVHGNDRPGRIGITADKGVQDPLEHVENQPRHARDVHGDLERRFLARSRARLAILLASSPTRSRFCESSWPPYQPQVAGQGRLGEQVNGQFVDLDLEPVEDVVSSSDLAGQVSSRLTRASMARVDRRSGVAGHGQQPLLQFGEFLFEDAS